MVAPRIRVRTALICAIRSGMALSPKVFAGIALAAGVAVAAVIVNSNGTGGPAATPTPVARRTSAPTPAVDPAKLPAAYRADMNLPANVAQNLVFIEEMLNGPHRPTMDQVTCHCCNKSLSQCYMDTATKADKACSPLCSVCQHEGKDVIAAAKIGMPIQELRDGLARTYGNHEEAGSHGAGDGHNHAHPM